MAVLLLLLSGLCLFLGGLRLMTAGLEAMCGSSFALAVRRYTGNRFCAFLCGLLFACLTQSSSLVTVIVVGVVDAGIIGLGAAIAVIIGANVGTTVTGQLLSLQLYDYALPLAGAGMIPALLGQRAVRQGGRALLGLGVLLYGLKTMGGALVPLAEAPWFAQLLQAAALHPLVGVMAGTLSAALVQSSSAVVGMTLALAEEGVLTIAAGAAVIVGADVGTCVTSLLAGLGSGRAARQAAAAHLLFNVLSVLLVLPFFPLFIQVAAATSEELTRQLANAHSLYNGSGAVLMLLFLTPFKKLVETLVSTENTEKKRITNVFGEVIRRWF